MPSRTSREPEKPPRGRLLVSHFGPDGSVTETVLRGEPPRTAFCVFQAGSVAFRPAVFVDGQRRIPYTPRNNLLEHQVVLLPEGPEEYGSVGDLVGEIRDFIHRHVDVTELFEAVTAYYVLLTWVYDAFDALPYLRLRGDPGTGKTRFLLTVGSLCYKPIFASGASTVSPIFRILDSFRGTLILDEGDFRATDERAEIVKILNNGNARGFPVLRSEATPQKEYNPTAYAVFGPKIIATRGPFEDRALETRCLTEEMGDRPLRVDIPVNLPANYATEAKRLRNKLLLFRFRHRNRLGAEERLVDRGIEPRLGQVFTPLLSVIEEESEREAVRALARRYHRDLQLDRSQDIEADLLALLRELMTTGTGNPSVQELARRFAERHGDDVERRVTPKWIGGLLRRRLHIQPARQRGVFVVPRSARGRVEELCERYGLGAEEVELPVPHTEPVVDIEDIEDVEMG
jgi:hypothetical protein